MTHPAVWLTQAEQRQTLIATLDCLGSTRTRTADRLPGTDAALRQGRLLPAAGMDLLFRTRSGLTSGVDPGWVGVRLAAHSL